MYIHFFVIFIIQTIKMMENILRGVGGGGRGESFKKQMGLYKEHVGAKEYP